ncbi:MAG: hypothetical protein RLZZ140_1156 [Pseudomonadota bacterium]|jgi:hypothetical protein
MKAEQELLLAASCLKFQLICVTEPNGLLHKSRSTEIVSFMLENNEKPGNTYLPGFC